MKSLNVVIQLLLVSGLLFSCQKTQPLKLQIYQTSAGGDQLTEKQPIEDTEASDKIVVKLFPDSTYQSIEGFGGAFTESSAYLVKQLSAKNRHKILQAYFGDEGAKYSLTRTHINSCDFSLHNYAYDTVPNDTLLTHFSIAEDMDDIVPMIKDAQMISTDGFKILSSPWTAPRWMKNNNSYVGGKLLPQYYDTWAKYFVKYVEAYKKEGVDIWGVTVENEPLGNGNNWESMIFTPEETADFVKHHLGPQLSNNNLDVKILVYDQNRDEVEEWAEAILKDDEASPFVYGTAVHWYASTYKWFPKALNFTHSINPDKHIIQTEACVDAQVPQWQDDKWYWSKEATDWGYTWAPEDKKKDHPKYAPVYRYARDIIGCLNNWVEGWIDWNMVLDTKGGPNWAKNWCVAPVIVDAEKDEVYFTPIYYALSHFSKFIRPGDVRIGFQIEDKLPQKDFMMTATKSSDGTTKVVLLNMSDTSQKIELQQNSSKSLVEISPKAIQTIIISANQK